MATDEPVMAGMAGRYAAALFELAEDEHVLPQVEQDLSRFASLVSLSDDLKRLIRSPVFSADEQEAALAALLQRAGIAGLTANFLRLVARNRRLFAVLDMIDTFRAMAARARGEVRASVTSAFPLKEDQVAALKDALRLSVGKDVTLSTEVDPALLGGLVVKVGSRMIDSSLRTKLNSLKIRMKEVG